MEMIENSEIILLIASFLLSAFFSGSEAVLMTIGIDRAHQILKEGGSKSQIMKFMIEKPNELLTTILIGNNIVNIFAAALITNISTRMFKSDAVGIAVGVTTILVLIFGEIIPKTFARTHSEKLSVFVLSALKMMYFFTYPIVQGTVFAIRLFLGENAELKSKLVTKNDIEYMVQKAEEENSIDSKQLDMLNSILEFPTIKIKDIMVPRPKVKSIQLNATFNDVIDGIKFEGHSRYPVCDGELENTIGFVHIKDLAFIRGKDKSDFSLNNLVKEPFYVYEHMKIQSVFDHMNKKKIHMALVKDENAIIVGVVTLEDIVEQILGEIQDEHDKEESKTSASDRTVDLQSGISVEGSINLLDLDNEFDIKIPLNDSYSTLNGFVLDMLGDNFPSEGQIIVWAGLSFELLKVNEFEIRTIRIKDIEGKKHYFSKKETNESEKNQPNKEDTTNLKFS